MSRRLGFLTGDESDIMLDAHAQADFLVGMPKSGGNDFVSDNITQGVTNLGSRMLRHRLTPPPEEAYSLHKKLSGAFLACIKLKAIVPCRELLLEVYEKYGFGEESGKNLVDKLNVIGALEVIFLTRSSLEPHIDYESEMHPFLNPAP